MSRRDDRGASPAATGLSPSVEPASSLDGFATSIPSAADLRAKTPEQIGQMLSALTVFINSWSAIVAKAEEHARMDRELLMGAMAELTRLTHFVARSAADVLDAQGIEARSDETAQQAQPEGQEPGPEGMRP